MLLCPAHAHTGGCLVGTFAYSLQLFSTLPGTASWALVWGRCWVSSSRKLRLSYVSLSIQGFWRRWHMTLGTWLRDYLYVPLGGSRVGPGVHLNLMLIMVISGLWHGADSFNFVIWGVLHGLAMLLQRFWSRNGGPDLPKVLSWLLTMGFVISAWTIFRARISQRPGPCTWDSGVSWGAAGAEIAHDAAPVHGWAFL